MENSTNFRQLLGMKQENMAMLLQIPMSQWAMYATGKRNLPIAAKLKLAEMLEFLSQKEKKGISDLDFEKKQNQEIEKYIVSQQLANANLQISFKQKLTIIEKKHETAVKAINFINFLESKTKNPTKTTQLLLQSIKQNAEIELQKNSLLEQTKLQIKIESLEVEERMLNRKYKN